MLAATPRPAPSREERVFGYHGILCEDRQLETVVEGFERAAGRDPRFRLLLCGDGESARSLRELAARSPAADRIEFTGRYRADEQQALYARADFGIVSLRDTPFTRHTVGNKFFDYPAQGIPFLYPSLPVLQRIAARIGSGFAFRPGDPASFAEAMVAAAATDYAGASARGIAAVGAEFTWDRDRERLLRMLERAVGRR
jgi:glycosyltransferase involved in cell wall biosynthesis